MATSRDVQEVISRLSSDKAKPREEGLRLLSTWLEGDRSVGFCRLIGRRTASLKPDEIPHSETWPFLLNLLMNCVKMEISSSKKRPPKLLPAKMLRTCVQRADDAKFSGKGLVLLSVIKLLFYHILDVVKSVAIYQSEYSMMLRHLLSVKEYRYQMRKRIYCSFVLLYIHNIVIAVDGKGQFLANTKEEAFRNVSTLHILLENPPGDFPSNLREDVVKGFTGVCSQIREEGKVSRKLLECITTYLLKDGPNLGTEAMAIHSSLQDFVLRYWHTTHDKGLKSLFILYAKLQLKLNKSSDGTFLVEQLLDVVDREFDQSIIASTGISKVDATREDKATGTLCSLEQDLMELAASLYYKLCTRKLTSSNEVKRRRRENPVNFLKDRLLKGNFLWCGSFYFLVHYYGDKIYISHLIDWFEGISGSIERTLAHSTSVHCYDGFIWLLRALVKFSSILPRSNFDESVLNSSLISNKVKGGWRVIWNSLMHGLLVFSNITQVADAAMLLLGNMISKDIISLPLVPRDVWELPILKNMPSSSALYFISCYFSRIGIQSDLGDMFVLRRNLLKSALGLITVKGTIVLNEWVAALLPAAISSLCCGSCPFSYEDFPIFLETIDLRNKAEEIYQPGALETLDYSVENLSEIGTRKSSKVIQKDAHHSVRLPQEMRQSLVSDTEEYLLQSVTACEEKDMVDLPELLFTCSFMCNCIYGLNLAWLHKKRSFFIQMLEHILKLLERAIFFIEERRNEVQNSGISGTGSLFEAMGSTISSLRSLTCSPLFRLSGDSIGVDGELPFVKSLERLLFAFAALFKDLSLCSSNMDSFCMSPLPDSHSIFPSGGGNLRIVDMELDVHDGSNEADGFAVSESSSLPSSFSFTQWKSDMISGISFFFSVLPIITWDCLFDICGLESDTKVQYKIISHLCKSFPGHGCDLLKLVNSIENMIEKESSCAHVVTLINYLLENLVSCFDGKGDNSKYMKEMVSEQKLQHVADLVNKLANFGLPDWSARVQLIGCICHLVVLDPGIGQAMIIMLLPMLQDTDFRVRLFLARQIGTLFQTWDGHDELFQDVCSHFGLQLVMASREKLVKAQDVLPSSRPSLIMETTMITLAHVAVYSEKLEFEVVFMLCAVAAMDPPQRELVSAILDGVSRLLQCSSRTKYLEELMGPILCRWVTCEISLTSLVELRELFLVSADANSFMILCCSWLLPSLFIHQDMDNLNLVSTIAGQPLAFLARSHFVQIFSLCIALHCSDNPKKETAELVLHSSLLHIAEISELERDNLIKRYMVSIVGQLLSLLSSSSVPTMPFFSQEDITLSLQTVVDGFLDIDNKSSSIVLADKLNIFRPDRVFKFLLEIHYQITRAGHPRHKCHHLSRVEVLINIIGRRATAPSTSYYIFNLVGQFIGDHALQDQCCGILSTLLAVFKTNLTNDVLCVLGKQLQFLVSKLVGCFLPCSKSDEGYVVPSSRVLLLLHQLTVEADPLLHDFIRELQPFPDLDCFSRIREFHEEICGRYSPRDHFLKFVKSACHLSQSSLVWSLQSLHKKLVLRKSIEPDRTVAGSSLDCNSWDYDPELVSAVWDLAAMCNIEEVQRVGGLVADFIARVGIGDPYRVVFRLPGDSVQKQYGLLHENYVSHETIVSGNLGISDEHLINLIQLVKKYLIDDCVTTVDVASRTLRGILSTGRGQAALLHFDTYERSLIAVHSKGVDHKLVEVLLKESREKYSETSWDLSSIWTTHAKTYKMWICPLVHFLISYSDDIILQLCQDIVLLAEEIAEFLFPLLLLNLAGRNDLNVDICHLMSEKVQEDIFVESNKLIKSVQLFLHTLNRLRSYYVTEKASLSSMPFKQGRASSSSRTRSTIEKSKDPSWRKVYWLSIDYLLVAKAALRCGCFFTAVMYVEYWCEEHFGGLSLGYPNFSSLEMLEPHVELLIGAVTQINEPDSIYGIIQTHKLTSQIVTFEHEENWSKALEYYDLLVRTSERRNSDGSSGNASSQFSEGEFGLSSFTEANKIENWKSHKGLMKSLQQIGCTHVLNVFCQGLASQKDHFQEDPEFSELQYEAAWRAGNWDFSLITSETKSSCCLQHFENIHFNENLHSCLRAFQEGSCDEFCMKLDDLKKELILLISNASHESTLYIHSTIVKIQILDHLSVAWDLRWTSYVDKKERLCPDSIKKFPEPAFPSIVQMKRLNEDWNIILRQMQLNLNLLEPFIAFRSILLKILNCKECRIEYLLQSASALRKGARYSLAVAALHEFKLLCGQAEQSGTSYLCSLGRIEEARVLWAQGQHELAINLAKYILVHYQLGGEAPNLYRLVGKWLAETHSSNSRIVLEQYLKRSVELTEVHKTSDKKCLSRQCQTYFNLAHYTDALFKSYEERLSSSEWQAALRLRKHKAKELDALIRRLKGSSKGEKIDYSVKIQELQKQLTMDKEEAEKLEDDRDNFLNLALEGYQRCLVIGSKYDIRVVFRLVSLWFSLSSRQTVIESMLNTVKEVQSYKFIPLVYQIASRMGSSKDVHGSLSFQAALISLVKKMAVDHPYHTIYQLLALANGDRVKDKQRSRNSFVVDLDKKQAAENLLKELSSYHGEILTQMKQTVEIYIKLAELETKKEETNKRMPLPREIRNVRQLELVPVVTATFPVDPSCEYNEGSFPHFKGLVDSIMVMNGINAPKVVECIGSDGNKYRQLAKSGNDDLRQDAVMEQFFGLVNTFLQGHRDTWKRKIKIHTYKVIPFTPSAGVLEWVNGTVPLGEYLLGSTRNGGAHGRYGIGDWSFLHCREHMATEKDKRKAFQNVCDNFRPVMHYFFLERFLQPSDWFEKRISYTRSVAASSMVGYIVGLGDRHAMNVLIDQASAEVVHIDLGVAFEQGLMLKTPERVPFRLTRDMIDGMGVTGVEGVFRRCCEETLSVMRTNKEALLTIIEVFIHDPLYKWALSPLKALQRQKETYDSDSNLDNSEDACEGNKDAACALLRVKQKLDGYEDGEIRSVQGQVQQLIQDAIDTERLCQMFPGWAAWL